MADTFVHATQGSLLLLAPFLRLIRRKTVLYGVIFTGAFFGALPDLIGAYGNFVVHDHWALYRSAHFGPIKDVLQYVPMYWLHLYVDLHMHGPGHRWWLPSERLWLECAMWMVNLLLIWYFVRIRNGKPIMPALHHTDR